MARRLWNILLREPLAQFALAGGLVFLAYSLTASPPAETIVITPDMVDAAVRQRAEQNGESVSQIDRHAVTDELVEEELLVREAYRRGIDRSDRAIRQRLADKMRFFLVGEPPAPSDEQLREFFHRHADRYKASGEAKFEDLLPEIKQHWLQDQRQEAMRRGMEELRREYRVEIAREKSP